MLKLLLFLKLIFIMQLIEKPITRTAFINTHCKWQKAEESKECVFEKGYYTPFINHHFSFWPPTPYQNFVILKAKLHFFQIPLFLKTWNWSLSFSPCYRKLLDKQLFIRLRQKSKMFYTYFTRNRLRKLYYWSSGHQLLWTVHILPDTCICLTVLWTYIHI